MSALARASSLFGAAMRTPGLARAGAAAPAAPAAARALASATGGAPELGTVADILAAKGEVFYSAKADSLVIDAVKEMVRHNIGSLIIVDASDKPIGIVTETDYLSKMIVRGRSSYDTQVKEIMSTKSFTSVTSRDSLPHCMELMSSVKIRHLPVIEDGKVLGMLSVGDIVKELVSTYKKNAEHLRDFISGGY